MQPGLEKSSLINSLKKILKNGSRVKMFFLQAGCCLLAFIATGCYTLKTTYQPADWLGVFPPDCSGYLVIKKNIAPLFSTLNDPQLVQFIRDKDIRAIADKTEKLYCAFKKGAGQRSEFYLILLGNYPYLSGNIALDFNKDWQRSGDAAPFYYHRESNLKIALADWYLIFLTNGDISVLLNHYRKAHPFPLKPDIGSRLATADLFLYFPDFAGSAIPDTIPFNKQRLPVREGWVYGIVPAGDNRTSKAQEDKAQAENTGVFDTQAGNAGSGMAPLLNYRLGGGFNLEEEAQAVLFLKSFRLFLPWLLKEAGISTKAVAAKLKNVELGNTGSGAVFNHLDLTGEELGRAAAVFIRNNSGIAGERTTEYGEK